MESQKIHCKLAKSAGYPYELYYYEAGEKRDPTKPFLKLKRRGSKRKVGNGLLVPVRARRYR